MKVAATAVEAIAERRSGSLSTLVRDEIERMILGGEIEAGGRLKEAALAAQLGVSRGPVREAVRALERDGLVSAVVNQGAFVRQLSIDEAAELYELRAVIVGRVCGHLASSATAEERAELASLVHAMSEAVAARDAPGYYELNLRFHERIMQMSGQRRSAALYRSLVKEAHLFRRRALLEPEAMHESNDEHRAMVAAIEAGDGLAARDAAETHHVNGKRRWLDTLEWTSERTSGEPHSAEPTTETDA